MIILRLTAPKMRGLERGHANQKHKKHVIATCSVHPEVNMVSSSADVRGKMVASADQVALTRFTDRAMTDLVIEFFCNAQ